MGETEAETNKAAKRGKCESCGRDVAVKKDGAPRHHQRWVGGPTQFPPVCDGRSVVSQ